MTIRIYQPTKTATQSGRANSEHWVVEFARSGDRKIDDLMGWTGSGDTRAQISLKFASRDQAVNYVRKRGLSFQVEEPQKRLVRPKSYAENFVRKV